MELSRRGFLGILGAAGASIIIPERVLELPQQFERVPRNTFACALVDTRNRVVAAKTVPAQVMFCGELVDWAPEELDFHGEPDLAIAQLGIYLPAAGEPQFVPFAEPRLVQRGHHLTAQVRPFRNPTPPNLT